MHFTTSIYIYIYIYNQLSTRTRNVIEKITTSANENV